MSILTDSQGAAGEIMPTKALSEKLEEFRQKLKEHQELWGSSLDRHIPQYPIRNQEKLKSQSEWLTRRLGVLRSEIEKFENGWTMIHPGSGATWDALEAAVGLSQVALAKGSSLQNVIEKLNIVIGKIEALSEHDRDQNNITLDVNEYQLHPFVRSKCFALLSGGHYDQAKLEGCKAVFEHIRNKSSITLDGTALAEKFRRKIVVNSVGVKFLMLK